MTHTNIPMYICIQYIWHTTYILSATIYIYKREKQQNKLNRGGLNHGSYLQAKVMHSIKSPLFYWVYRHSSYLVFKDPGSKSTLFFHKILLLVASASILCTLVVRYFPINSVIIIISLVGCFYESKNPQKRNISLAGHPVVPLLRGPSGQRSVCPMHVLLLFNDDD